MSSRSLDPSRKRSHPLLGRSGHHHHEPSVETPAKRAAPKPAWDSTTHDLSKYALSPEQLLRKKLAAISPNDTNAQATLRRRLAASGLVDATTLVRGADGAVKAVELLPAATQRFMNASYVSSFSRAPGGDEDAPVSLNASFATAPAKRGLARDDLGTPSTRVSGSPRASVGAHTPSVPRVIAAAAFSTRSTARRSLRAHEVATDGWEGDLLTGGGGSGEGVVSKEQSFVSGGEGDVIRPSPAAPRSSRYRSPYAAAPAALAALGLRATPSSASTRRVRPREEADAATEASELDVSGAPSFSWAATASPPAKRGGAGASPRDDGSEEEDRASALGQRLRQARARVSTSVTTARAAAVAAAAARPPPVPPPRSVRVRLPARLAAAFSDAMCVPVPEAIVTSGAEAAVVVERDLSNASFASAARADVVAEADEESGVGCAGLDDSLSTIGPAPEDDGPSETTAAAVETAPAAPVVSAVAHESVRRSGEEAAQTEEPLPLTAALEVVFTAGMAAAAAAAPPSARACTPPPAPLATPVSSVVESIMARYEARVKELLGETVASTVLVAPPAAPAVAAPAAPAVVAATAPAPTWELPEDAAEDDEEMYYAAEGGEKEEAEEEEEEEEEDELCYVPEVEAGAEEDSDLAPRSDAPPAPSAPTPAVLPSTSALQAALAANESLSRLRDWITTLRAAEGAAVVVAAAEEPLPSSSSLLLHDPADASDAQEAPAAASHSVSASGAGQLMWMAAPASAAAGGEEAGSAFAHHASQEAPYDPSRYAELSPEEEADAAAELEEALVMPPVAYRAARW